MKFTIAEKTIFTKATPQAIWKIWADVSQWPKWDAEVEWASLDGEFRENQTGKLKPRGGPEARFKITDCIPDQKFSDISFLPLARLVFDHWVKPAEGGNLVTHKITIEGPLSFLFYLLLAKKLKNGLDESLPRLVERAEAYGKK